MDKRDILEHDTGRSPGEGSDQAGAERPVTVPRTLKSKVRRLLRLSRKVGVAVAGGSVVLVGIALLFLPAPGSVVIPLGLAVLATEFTWARRLLRYVKTLVARARPTRDSWSVKRPLGSASGPPRPT